MTFIHMLSEVPLTKSHPLFTITGYIEKQKGMLKDIF